ncbi:hypothetical protein [Agrobacterium rosae]|uniref:Uncharacterized protein n=1 Tax=Agrobacterium rosae TaxID=1972867 RepID=A0A1R3TJP7_9HYPH|nr:hypothetical protein [Agrobacterium rosae]SCX03944.1 hypothetical protein DSM25559_0372 [Agrobacterium rosae]
MLQAVISGKAGTIPVGGRDEKVSWRKVFRISEDLLTASVFGRLAYLDDAVLWRIMRRTFGAPLPDLRVAELEDISFWPRWTDAIEDGRNVEPDVFMDFKLGDPAIQLRLIVEAKLWKYPSQDARQWAREWVAYQDAFGDDGQVAFLCALGGLGKKVDETVTRIATEVLALGHEIKIAAAGWDRLLEALEEERRSPTTRAMTRIIDDVVAALALADYQHLKLPFDMTHHTRSWKPSASAVLRNFT